MLNNLSDIVFPECCAGCAAPLMNRENTICLHCKEELPFTNFADEPENDTEKIFWGRVPLEAASSMIYFMKGGTIQNMLHQLKYNEQKEVGVELGRMAGKDIAASRRFSGIDLIVPIPLHQKKLRKRGYNQCSFLARGMSEVTGTPFTDEALKKVSHNESQTRKSRFQRWLNVKTIFQTTDPRLLKNKHILLIDDVVTTGATLEAAAQKLLEAEGVKVSIYTIGLTKL